MVLSNSKTSGFKLEPFPNILKSDLESENIIDDRSLSEKVLLPKKFILEILDNSLSDIWKIKFILSRLTFSVTTLTEES